MREQSTHLILEDVSDVVGGQDWGGLLIWQPDVLVARCPGFGLLEPAVVSDELDVWKYWGLTCFAHAGCGFEYRRWQALLKM